MAKKLRVGVIFGGQSGEHEVSIRSAGSVIQAIDSSRYEIIPVAISKEGKWLSPPQASALLSEPAQAKLANRIESSTGKDIAILGDPSHRGLITLNPNNSSQSEPLDIVFPLLHGPYGEDGTIQGLLEMANVPYVGCGVLASSCGMDKVAMKSLFREADLPICKHIWFLRSEWRKDPEGILRRAKQKLGYPCFVKPANLGSSVGISKATDKKSLEQGIDLAARYDRKIIIEEFVEAREIECAILGNDDPVASLPGEYVIHEESARFLDYTEKYSSTGHVDFVVPARLSKSLTQKLQRMAIRAFKSIDGAGLARVDFFVTPDNKLIINELNTMPGLTDVSGYPKMWAGSGLKFQEVIDRLVELAFERHRDKMQNKTSL
ncbi:MAG TPA: D-alanine--D-alanine ligase family protein [Pyrinomonadaceae bacterium]|nr:D-alanine--D-alanine ligase family protein [Pyrinomonadaceae bacterium]